MKKIPLEQIMKALGDPVRLSVVKQLLSSACTGEKPCGTFEHGVTKATFSHHLKILEEAGLVVTRQDGTKKQLSVPVAELKKDYPGLIDLLKS